MSQRETLVWDLNCLIDFENSTCAVSRNVQILQNMTSLPSFTKRIPTISDDVRRFKCDSYFQTTAPTCFYVERINMDPRIENEASC